jgi:hypothetical protein
MVKRSALALLVGAALSIPSAARAQPAERPRPNPYDRGRISLGFSAGTQSSLVGDDRHIYVGGGVGYFVLPGLEVAGQGIYLFGADPSVAMLSPQLRYVFYQIPWSIKPYVGGFHTHWFIGDGFADIDTLGARAGAVTVSGGLLIGLGVAYEVVVSDCSGDCDLVYPELTLAVAF